MAGVMAAPSTPIISSWPIFSAGDIVRISASTASSCASVVRLAIPPGRSSPVIMAHPTSTIIAASPAATVRHGPIIVRATGSARDAVADDVKHRRDRVAPGELLALLVRPPAIGDGHFADASAELRE